MGNLISLIIFLVVLVGVVTLVNILLKKRTAKLDNLPYRKKEYLLTPAERSFYEVLKRVTGDDIQVFAKVRLADLIWLPKGTKNRQTYLNRILSKHVDFVLCNRETVSPVLVIELDDSSHNMGHRQDRDTVLNEILHSAGLPFLRIPAKHSYAPSELSELIRNEISRMGMENSTRAHG